MTEKMDFKYCIFCDKLEANETNELSEGNDSSSDNSFKLFLQLIKRYLGVEDNFRDILNGESNQFRMVPCETCLNSVKSINEAYHEMRLLELKVQMQIAMLMEVIREEEVVGTQRETLEKLFGSKNYWKLSEERVNWKRSCSERLLKCPPNVKLKRISSGLSREERPTTDNNYYYQIMAFRFCHKWLISLTIVGSLLMSGSNITRLSETCLDDIDLHDSKQKNNPTIKADIVSDDDCEETNFGIGANSPSHSYHSMEQPIPNQPATCIKTVDTAPEYSKASNSVSNPIDVTTTHNSDGTAGQEVVSFIPSKPSNCRDTSVTRKTLSKSPYGLRNKTTQRLVTVETPDSDCASGDSSSTSDDDMDWNETGVPSPAHSDNSVDIVSEVEPPFSNELLCDLEVVGSNKIIKTIPANTTSVAATAEESRSGTQTDQGNICIPENSKYVVISLNDVHRESKTDSTVEMELSVSTDNAEKKTVPELTAGTSHENPSGVYRQPPRPPIKTANPLKKKNKKAKAYCTDCRKSFKSPREYKVHAKLHGTWKCQFCPVEESFAKNLAIHEMENHRSPESPKSCPRCTWSCKLKGSCVNMIAKHFITKHLNLDANVFECPTCQKSFASNKSRRSHVKHEHDRVTEANRIQCDKCSQFFETDRKLVWHKRKSHNIGVSQSARRPGPGGTIPCENADCVWTFDDKDDMVYHKYFTCNVYRGITKNPAICQFCGKSYKTEWALQAHMKAHDPSVESERKCNICSKVFKRKTTLDTHYEYHKRPEEWKFLCSVCSKKCVSKQKLDEHMRTHTKEKPFICDVCGGKFAHRHNWRNHMESKHKDVKLEVRKYDQTSLVSRKGQKSGASLYSTKQDQEQS